MSENGSFERIREQVSRDLAPTQPLKPPAIGALVVLPLAIVLLGFLLLAYGLRGDAASLGFWPLFGPAAAMVGAAYIVVYLALVQRAPESTLSWVYWAAVPLAVVALEIGSGLVTFAASGANDAAVPLRAEAMCFLRISLMGVLPVLAGLWLLARGLPLQPKIAGLLAGLGGGFLAEGIYRLFCSLSSPAHMIPWHTGAVLVMGALGFAAGLLWERRTVNEWREGHA